MTPHLDNCAKLYEHHKRIDHRGPDNEGFVIKKNKRLAAFHGDRSSPSIKERFHSIRSQGDTELFLGHSRLAIIDLSDDGHQPFYNDRYCLVFNGEIFNYIEISHELKKRGYTMTSSCDTEVLFYSLIEWGVDAFRICNGMWALAFYDLQKNRLLLCRDRYGIKPLFYNHNDGSLYFASEIKALKTDRNNSSDINYNLIKKYLKSSIIIDADQTIWKSIHSLEPGHWMSFDDKGMEISSYYSIRETARRNNPDKALEEFDYLFTDSLKLRMRSDVEVGSLLSGGLDSSMIVSNIMDKDLKIGAYNAFTIDFDEKEYSEKKYVLETLKRYEFNDHFIKVSYEDYYNRIDRVLMNIDQPYRSMSVISGNILYEYIKENSNVKVVLNGQGADEQFLGYTSHYYWFFVDLLKKGQLDRLSRELQYFREYRNVAAMKIWAVISRLLIKNIIKNQSLEQQITHSIQGSPLAEYLIYDDRNSMCYGIESRVPFLDYRIVDFSINISPLNKINSGINKFILREHAKHYLPKSIVSRKDKMGFVTPQEKWQNLHMENIVQESEKKLMQYNFINKVIKNGKKKDWAMKWRIFCLNRWMEIHTI